MLNSNCRASQNLSKYLLRLWFRLNRSTDAWNMLCTVCLLVLWPDYCSQALSKVSHELWLSSKETIKYPYHINHHISLKKWNAYYFAFRFFILLYQTIAHTVLSGSVCIFVMVCSPKRSLSFFSRSLAISCECTKLISRSILICTSMAYTFPILRVFRL